MRRVVRIIRNVLIGLGMTAGVVVLMLYLFRVFHWKAGPQPLAPAGRLADANLLAEVKAVEMPRVESAVGTIRPVYESSVASKLLEKVVSIPVRAGEPVQKGQLLAQLDDTVLKARLGQAEAAVRGAQAACLDANQQASRIRAAFQRQVATQAELDSADAALASAQANLQRAGQALLEAQTLLGFATIRSPMDGIVTEKKVSEGDTVSPGQTLVVLYDPTRMQLVASVRESLAQHLEPNQPLEVVIDQLQARCLGTISEIVPEVQTASRSFLVKVTGPCHPGVYAGMFGRLRIPLGVERVLLVPQSAIRRVGQVQLVDVAAGGQLQRRAVTTGRTFGQEVEVLSGLREGEFVER